MGDLIQGRFPKKQSALSKVLGSDTVLGKKLSHLSMPLAIVSAGGSLASLINSGPNHSDAAEYGFNGLAGAAGGASLMANRAKKVASLAKGGLVGGGLGALLAAVSNKGWHKMDDDGVFDEIRKKR